MPGGSFTDWSSMGANAGDWLMTQSTNLGLNGMQGLGDAAFSLGNTIKGVDAWLKDIPGMSGGLGSALGYAGALYSLSQGNYGSAAGAAIGTWVLPGIGTMIGSTLGGLVDGLFGKSTPHAGAASEYQVGNLIGGNAQTAQNLVNAGDSYLEQMQKPMDSLVLTIGSSLDALAKNFGKTSGYSVGAGFTSDNNDKSAGFFHLITPEGQTLDKWTISRNDKHYKERGGMYDSDSAKGFDEYLKDVAFASLSGVADIVPAWAADMAKATKDSLADASGADSITAFQNLVTQIAVIEGAFTSLGQVMPMFVGITDDMKSSFLELFGTIDNLTAATSSFYGLLYSEQERMTTAGNQINDTLKELNIFSERGGIDVFNGVAAKAQLKLAVEELMAAGNAELAGKLMLMTQSFVSVADYAAKAAQEAAKAAQDAYNNARDAAFANLESAVDRERSYWDGIASAAQTAVSSLSSTLNLLTSNARDLYGTVDTTQQMLAVQGMVYIEDALAGVRGGASASNYSGLQDAITAARGGISGGRYASQFDKDRDALVLAGQLSQLGDLTGNQLSVEERSLKAAQTQIDLLDQTLDYWRELIDGNKDGNLSVVEAINRLAQAMGVTASGPGGLLGGGGASFGGGSGVTGTAGAADPESFKYIRDTWLYDNHYARRGTNDAALDPLADLMRSFSGTGDVAGMLTAARDAGYRLSDVQAASTAVDGVWRASTYAQWLLEAQRVGIPAFDVGTNLVPHDMLAVVHKNEAIVPAAFNPWAGGSGMGMSTARLESLVERLIDENRHLSDRLLAIERNTQGLPQMADQFDTVASSGRVRVAS